MGWICPVCGAGNNPVALACWKCERQSITLSNTDQLQGKHMFWQALPETMALKFGAGIEGGTPEPSNVMAMDVPKVRGPFVVDTSDDPPHIKIYLPENCPEELKSQFKLTAKVLCYVWVPNSNSLPNMEKDFVFRDLTANICDDGWEFWHNHGNDGTLFVYFRELDK